MKWMLLVLIYGTIPVKTGLVFDTIDDCLKAEERRIRPRLQRLAFMGRSQSEGVTISRQSEVQLAARRHGDDRNVHPLCRGCRHAGLSPPVSGQFPPLLLEQARMRDPDRFGQGSYLAPASNPDITRPIGERSTRASRRSR
jgi:hypothetical protein